MVISSEQLIHEPMQLRPHVVLLGSGASCAAFPQGDANGRHLPAMDDLVEMVGLKPIIDEAGFKTVPAGNFEEIYSRMHMEPRFKKILNQIELRIDDFFSKLELPPQPTIYDRILVSLRPSDAIFTLNWDPFLFDAYRRNHGEISLPGIFFLHGNVRIGACKTHLNWGARHILCPECSLPFTDVPLLYPIQQKNYSSDIYIQQSWEAAKEYFTNAFMITIFGYGAPSSDVDAVDLLKNAWLEKSSRTFEHIEIIDTAPADILADRWRDFTPTLHYQIHSEFNQSRIARWPRRTCESLYYPMSKGQPCEDFPLLPSKSIEELHSQVQEIAQHETAI